MEDIYQLISNLGFPIVVSLILLLRIETRLENLTKAINELSQAILSLSKN
uniref:YvrJ family protein n=1 Tax=Dictyoglomus thermophilum TaxID=14 RepID=A0A7C3RV06_DICTH